MTLAVAAGAGLAIALGGLVPALFLGRRWPSTLLLGASGGAVLAVVGLEVVPAAWARGSPPLLAASLAAGVGLMGGLHLLLESGGRGQGHRQARGGGVRPGRHPVGGGGGLCPAHGHEHWLRVGFLTWLAVALHNVLDGFGIGAGFGESEHLGLALAAAVAVHNVPVGMLVATPLLLGRAGAARVVVNTVLAAMCTPLGAVLGEGLAGLSARALAASLGLAGGSLLFILGELLHMAWGESRVLTLAGGAAGVLLVILAHGLGGH